MKLYGILACVSNMTSDSLCVYLNPYSVTDSSNQRMVKYKMLSIYKPGLRRILSSAALDSHQGVFGGDQAVIEKLKEHKDEQEVENSSLSSYLTWQ